MSEEKIYLLLDSGNAPLARGKLECPIDAPSLQIQVLDGKVDDVVRHEIIQLVGMGANELPRQCRLLRRRNDRIVLEVMAVLDQEIRRNLRVPVKFDSFIYPLTGAWKGRQRVRSIDLSCGGIAFYGATGLEDGEEMEVVIPITDQPLILRCQILRQQELKNGRTFYSAKFVDMCDDEEFMVRKAVFSIQLMDNLSRDSAETED